jgi:hypothetical protein
MDMLVPGPVPMHIASDMGWHLLEYIYYAGSALLLGIAAWLIISGRRERSGDAGEQPERTRAERLK